MPALAPGDSERLLHFVAEAESFGGDHPFEGEFLTQLGRLIPADWIGYADRYGLPEGPGALETYYADGGPTTFARPGDEGFYSGMDWAAVMPAVEAEDCPILQRVRRGGYATFKISDFVGRRELYRTSSFKLLLEPYGLADSLELRLAIEPGEGKFTFDRGGRDFSARDLAVLDALNRHLVQLYRKSESRRRLREALALHESTQAAVVLLEAGHRVAFASTAASELLDGYFGENGVGLPDAVVSWLGERRRGATDEPLRVDVGGRSLVVELVDGALLLEEQQDLPRLTPREREILDLVAEGRTNAEIAERLWVSPVTVRKHLENVYAKLGVHTRTAAVALIGGRSRPSEDR